MRRKICIERRTQGLLIKAGILGSLARLIQATSKPLIQPRRTIRPLLATNPNCHFDTLVRISRIGKSLDRVSASNSGDTISMLVILMIVLVFGQGSCMVVGNPLGNTHRDGLGSGTGSGFRLDLGSRFAASWFGNVHGKETADGCPARSMDDLLRISSRRDLSRGLVVFPYLQHTR